MFSSRVFSFYSVVDVSDIDRVDERCAQLLPDVHNQLIPKIVFWHIPHLSKGKELKKILWVLNGISHREAIK